MWSFARRCGCGLFAAWAEKSTKDLADDPWVSPKTLSVDSTAQVRPRDSDCFRRLLYRSAVQPCRRADEKPAHLNSGSLHIEKYYGTMVLVLRYFVLAVVLPSRAQTSPIPSLWVWGRGMGRGREKSITRAALLIDPFSLAGPHH